MASLGYKYDYHEIYHKEQVYCGCMDSLIKECEYQNFYLLKDEITIYTGYPITGVQSWQ